MWQESRDCQEMGRREMRVRTRAAIHCIFNDRAQERTIAYFGQVRIPIPSGRTPTEKDAAIAFVPTSTTFTTPD